MYNYMNNQKTNKRQEKADLKQYVQDLFKNRVFSIKDTGLTYRIINNWSQKGLIDHFREADKEWHRFSFAQLVEISIYNEFRIAGFSLNKLLKIKEAINEKHISSSGNIIFIYEIEQPLTPLTDILMRVLYRRENCFLVADSSCRNIGFFSELIFAEIITGISPLTEETYQENAGIFFIGIKMLLNKLKIKTENYNSKLALLLNAILDSENVNGEDFLISSSYNDNSDLKIKKIKKKEYKNIKEIKDLKKIINQPNQSVTIHSDNFGAHKIVIEKEIK